MEGRSSATQEAQRGAGSELVKEHTLHWMLGKEDRRWVGGGQQGSSHHRKTLFGTEALVGQWNRAWASLGDFV